MSRTNVKKPGFALAQGRIRARGYAHGRGIDSRVARRCGGIGLARESDLGLKVCDG